MPAEIRKALNQQLLSFSFEDKDYNNALQIIDRQIFLTTDKLQHMKDIRSVKLVVPRLS